MSLFNSILSGLQKKIDSQNTYKETVIECLYQIIGVKITPNAIISLKDGILVVHTTPAIKMAILLKKENIITLLKERGVNVSIIR